MSARITSSVERRLPRAVLLAVEPDSREIDPGTTPDTILFIHGLWMTPRSWEKWAARYESRGYRVIAPAWPGMEAEIEELNRDPSPIASLDLDQVLAHYQEIIGDLDQPPIIMGHSLGGTMTQVLLDRGYGAVGVGVASAPAAAVDFDREGRTPLLFIAFGEDHVVPPKAVRHNEAKYDDTVSITEFREFPGRPHFPGAPGWEEVADFALSWAVEHTPQTVADHPAHD